VAETVGPALNNAALSFAVMVKVRPCAVSGSPSSMAEAQGSIDCAPESSSTVWFGPTVKLGASLMPLTVMVTFCGVLASTPPFAVPPLSLSTTVRVAVPDVLAVGVKLRTPAGDTAGPALNRPGLVFAVTLKLRVWPASSLAPALIAVAQGALCGPASSFTTGFAPGVNVGASLTGFTVMSNVCGALV